MLFSPEQPDLNDTDMAIYHFVIADPQGVCAMTIRDFADATHTSTASVLRFCKKFGVSGFSEFKVRLRAFLLAHNRADAAPQDTAQEDELIGFLSRAKDRYYRDRIDEAVALLLEKDLVIFIGLGSSGIVAEYGALYFASLFSMAVRIENPYDYPIEYLKPELAKHICVIALSVSGETKEVVAYLSHLNLSTSSIISITSTAHSTIARLSDVNIPYHLPQEKHREADITSQVPALFTIEKLAREVTRARASR